MISDTEIGQHCYPRTLRRAQQIASSDRNILTKMCRYNGDETMLSAFVASSSGWDDRYRTSVSFSESEDAVIDYSCTCPASYEYGGMCKHCAALILSYNESPERFMGYQEHRRPATSSCIADLMKRTAQKVNAAEEEDVSIETTLTYGFRLWSVHFKLVGPQGSYVLKSISDFVQHMRTGERFSYGKKLTFTHTPNALTPQARAVARFLERAVSLRAQASKTMHGYYSSRNEAARDLDLSDSEVVELLDTLGEGTFTVEGTDYGTRSLTKAHVMEADPSLEIRLHQTDEGGYAIGRTENLVVVTSGDRSYIWQDDIFYRCSPTFSPCAEFLRSVYESEDDQVVVTEEDMPLFCATILPAIEQGLIVQAPHSLKAYRPVPCQLEFYFDKTDQVVSCDPQARYGDKRHHLSDGASDRENEDAPGPLRDELMETKAKNLTRSYFSTIGSPLPLDDDEAIANLIFGGLLKFRALGTVFTTPAFDRLIRDGKPRVSLGVSLTGNLINLTISSEDLPSRELAAMLASYRKHKRYHRLKNGMFLNMEGFDLSQLDRLASDLGITAKQLTSGSVELPSYRAFYLDEEADLDRDRSFTRYVEEFRSVDELDYEVPESFAGTLRPYQVEGFRWLSARCDAGFGGILADEMGLGKSAQLIALLLSRQEEARATGPSLVVCPASLVYNWLAEFERFAPDLSVCAVVGTKRDRARIRKTPGCDILVTSYDLLRIDAADYTDRTFFCCVLDEAQYIKNPATLTTRNVKRINALHRFALTGTPIENRLSELWSIFDFLMPGLLGPYARFRERFELSIVGGGEDTARRLQALVGPFILRRLKIKVLRELPEKLESIVYAPLEGEQKRLYTAHEQQLRESLTSQKNDRKKNAKRGGDAEKSKVEILAELTKLRQLCCDPHLLYEDYTGHAAKLDAIMELVESAMDAGEKTLVFSQFTSFLSLIADQLDKQGVPYYTIVGSTPKKKRLVLVNAFNADDTPVFLVSLKAGGTGLNLTGATVVIHADPWWNAAAQDQATDRAHRIGQTKVVSVQKVIAQGTIEERIVHLQEAKSELAGQIIGTSGISLASLSKDDLIDLLQG